ncbi:hypothetical protein LguiA_029118 [Lonicera macranthoides]
MESLSQGVPIIGWPLAAEQAYNVKMLVEEMGVCVELTRGRDSVLLMEEVKRVIEQVMGENGEEMRKKACEIGELIRGAVKEGDDGVKGCSLQAMDDFVTPSVDLTINPLVYSPCMFVNMFNQSSKNSLQCVKSVSADSDKSPLDSLCKWSTKHEFDLKPVIV